jgi:plasmid maintenance system antidote protein VapI
MWPRIGRSALREIAELLKVHPQAVSNLLAGTQQLTGEQALVFRDFLDEQG